MNEPRVIDLTRHVDDRGDLAEIFRMSWDALPTGDIVQQVYSVFDPSPGTVRAYHRHKELWDLFHIAYGSAKFHLVRGPSRFPVPTGLQSLRHVEGGDAIITLSARKPQLLVVPPLWWHGWMSLEPGTLLISLANNEYNRASPDEERIDSCAFAPVWRVEAR